jgi:hypothetical protein
VLQLLSHLKLFYFQSLVAVVVAVAVAVVVAVVASLS